MMNWVPGKGRVAGRSEMPSITNVVAVASSTGAAKLETAPWSRTNDAVNVPPYALVSKVCCSLTLTVLGASTEIGTVVRRTVPLLNVNVKKPSGFAVAGATVTSCASLPESKATTPLPFRSSATSDPALVVANNVFANWPPLTFWGPNAKPWKLRLAMPSVLLVSTTRNTVPVFWLISMNSPASVTPNRLPVLRKLPNDKPVTRPASGPMGPSEPPTSGPLTPNEPSLEKPTAGVPELPSPLPAFPPTITAVTRLRATG